MGPRRQGVDHHDWAVRLEAPSGAPLHYVSPPWGHRAKGKTVDKMQMTKCLCGDDVDALAEVSRSHIDDAYIEAAREKWCSDDLEIDDSVAGGHGGPKVSMGGDGNGAWVSAWVWVTHEEAGIEEEDESEEVDDAEDDDSIGEQNGR